MIPNKTFKNNEAPALEDRDLNILIGEHNQVIEASKFAGRVPASSQPEPQELQDLARAVSNFAVAGNFCNASMTDNQYTLTPVYPLGTVPLEGGVYRFRCPEGNPTPQPSLKLNAMAEFLPLLGSDGSSLGSDALRADEEYSVRYDKSLNAFLLIRPGGSENGASASKDLSNTGMLTNAIIAAPNGVVVPGAALHWYDAFADMTDSQKKGARYCVKLSIGSIKSQATMTTDQLNGNWTLLTRIKVVANVSGQHTVYGPFCRIICKNESGVYGGNVELCLNNTSGASAPKPFLVRIYPDYGDTETTYNIQSTLVPDVDTWYWVKLVKTGTGFVLSCSSDNRTYTQLGSVSNVPAFKDTPDAIGKFHLGRPGSGSGEIYADLSDNSVNNIFLGIEQTPLITYKEGNQPSLTVKSGMMTLLPAGRTPEGLLRTTPYVLGTDIVLANPPLVQDVSYNVYLKSDGTVSVYEKSQVKIQDASPSGIAAPGDLLWYSPAQNTWRAYTKASNSWADVAVCPIASYQGRDGLVYDFVSCETFAFANRDLSNITTDAARFITGLGLPSKKYIDLPLNPKGSAYIAPANGYFCISFLTATEVLLYNNSCPGICWGIESSKNGVQCGYIPCKKGDNITYYYEMTTPRWVRFVYAQGDN